MYHIKLSVITWSGGGRFGKTVKAEVGTLALKIGENPCLLRHIEVGLSSEVERRWKGLCFLNQGIY